MPNRIIKESICTSETLDRLSSEEETFFVRILVNCDDYGRLDARPAVLLAKCYPLRVGKLSTNCIEIMLSKLIEAGLIVVYGGDRYLQVKTWNSHQQIRAKRSKYPDPASCPPVDNSADGDCNHLHASDGECSRNPIQSESNPNPIRNSFQSVLEDSILKECSPDFVQAEKTKCPFGKCDGSGKYVGKKILGNGPETKDWLFDCECKKLKKPAWAYCFG